MIEESDRNKASIPLPKDCRTLFKGIKSDLRNDSDGKIAKREADGG